jgi:dihydroxyacetone kinase-like protein
MVLETCLRDEIVSKCCEAIETNKHVLTELDQAIGDGDHGVNMSRGFEALKKAYQENREQDYSKLCQTLGLALVMNVGGASGPLFGSMVLGFGRASQHFPQTREDVRQIFTAGIDAVKHRGKSDVGAKTMLDVLVPVCEVLGREAASFDDVRICATQALGSTREMMATKGRGAFLRERSVGHVDPGAQSSFLLINAVCDAVELCNER